MRLGLRMGLNSRGAGGGGDIPSLDLQFATDKTLTARKGPTPVFTRASGATQVGSTGLIEFAPENQLTKSEEFNDAIWSKSAVSVTSNAIAAPNGTLTADAIIENTANTIHRVISQTITSLAGVPYSYSVYAKNNGRRYLFMNFSSLFSAAATFDLQSETIVIGSGSASITNVGDGWYRCTVTGTSVAGATAAGALQLNNSSVASDSTYLGDGVSGIYLWGAQLERYSTARTYIPTTTAAVYGARFDHDPITLACKGLLIEESRTNVGLQSEAFDTSTWDLGTQRNLTVAANNIASPSGSTTADKLTVGATTTVYQVIQATPTLTSGTVYTVSCFFKANQVTRVAIYATTTATLPVSAIFELSGSGTVVQTSFGTASIQRFSDGWYRCIITGTAGASVPTSVRISPVTGTSTTYTGNSVDSFYAWGYQLEVGAFPTSYIPTTTASVVRSADVCSISGADFAGIHNATEGTLFADITPQTVSQLSSVLYLGDGGSQFQNAIYKTNSALAAAGLRWGATTVSTGFVTQAGIVTATDVATSRSKLTYSFKLNDFAFAYAGSIIGTDTSGTLPATVPTQMGIGNRAGSLQINGHLASIRYYKKRLSNAKLVTLTA